VEYETWFWGNVRVVPKDPTLPLNSGDDYSNVGFAQDGPPVAHAVAPGSNIPECGTSHRILPYGFPWTHLLPDHWQRCPSCLSVQPAPETEDQPF
jgi:hypothetical protein